MNSVSVYDAKFPYDEFWQEGCNLRFGVLAPVEAGTTASPSWLLAFARHAEACGFESVVAVEHAITVRQSASTYPYGPDGRMPIEWNTDIPDPLDILSFLAGGTERLGLATGVLVIPNHHPVVLAKRAATVDALSEGRLRLCVGLGWMREEIVACGADFATRGRRADESIDVMRALWSGTHDDAGVTFHGEFFAMDGVYSFPRPVRPEGVPIHIGGHSEAAARRAGRRGDGFQPLGVRGSRVRELTAIMREEAERAQRDPDRLELTLGGLVSRTTPESVGAAADLGATRLVLAPTTTPDLNAVKDELSEFAQRLGTGEPATP